MDNVQKLLSLTTSLAGSDPRFLAIKGPGLGNKATSAFISTLRANALSSFGEDFAEKCICGDSALCVDYYFPHDKAIVEIAFGLRNPKTEFEKDVLKAVMAKEAGHHISRLVFFSKPGAKAKCAQPGRAGVIKWLRASHGIAVDIYEVGAA